MPEQSRALMDKEGPAIMHGATETSTATETETEGEVKSCRDMAATASRRKAARSDNGSTKSNPKPYTLKYMSNTLHSASCALTLNRGPLLGQHMQAETPASPRFQPPPRRVASVACINEMPGSPCALIPRFPHLFTTPYPRPSTLGAYTGGPSRSR